MAFFDNVRRLPPCRTCDSTAIRQNDLKIDFVRGYWKGEWVCENGHRNVIN